MTPLPGDDRTTPGGRGRASKNVTTCRSKTRLWAPITAGAGFFCGGDAVAPAPAPYRPLQRLASEHLHPGERVSTSHGNSATQFRGLGPDTRRHDGKGSTPPEPAPGSGGPGSPPSGAATTSPAWTLTGPSHNAAFRTEGQGGRPGPAAGPWPSFPEPAGPRRRSRPRKATAFAATRVQKRTTSSNATGQESKHRAWLNQFQRPGILRTRERRAGRGENPGKTGTPGCYTAKANPTAKAPRFHARWLIAPETAGQKVSTFWIPPEKKDKFPLVTGLYRSNPGSRPAEGKGSIGPSLAQPS